MDSGGIEGRVLDPIPLSAANVRGSSCSGGFLARIRTLSNPSGGSKFPPDQGSHRGGCSSFPRVLQSPLCSHKSFRRLETSVGRFQVEQVRPSDVLQYGITPNSDGCGSGRGLALLDRYEGRVPSYPHPPGFSGVPEVRVSRESVPVVFHFPSNFPLFLRYSRGSWHLSESGSI